MNTITLLRKLRAEARDEDGGITVLSIFLLIVMLLGAGFALDVNNSMQARVQLQGAADAAGHAAIYWRYKTEDMSTEDSLNAAMDRAVMVAEANMPTSLFGEVLADADVEFGDWDSVDRVFTPDPLNGTAVRVTTRRIDGRGNGLATHLMKLVGIDVLNLSAVSVWDAGDGYCPPRSSDKKRGEGFFAMGIVDIQSNNDYLDGFCIHSDTHVEFNNGNTYEDGVTVSMPDVADLVVPQFRQITSKNPGLLEALASIDYNLMSFFAEVPTLVQKYRDPYWKDQPDYITDMTVFTDTFSKNTKITMDMLTPNAVNIIKCQQNSVTIEGVLKDLVFIAECEINFSSGSAIENAVMISEATSNDAISGPSNIRIGATDYCTTGNGGATVISMGGFKASSGLSAFGANIIALGDIELTANTDGLGGVNFMTLGRIDATSNSDLGFCAEGAPETEFSIPVFRMAG